MTSRGPKRKVVADDVGVKKGKMDVLVQPKVEKVEVKVEEKLMQHSCPICHLKLECKAGDMVMKRRYMEKHFTSGGLLEMVAELSHGAKGLTTPNASKQVVFRRSSSSFLQLWVEQGRCWRQRRWLRYHQMRRRGRARWSRPP